MNNETLFALWLLAVVSMGIGYYRYTERTGKVGTGLLLMGIGLGIVTVALNELIRYFN